MKNKKNNTKKNIFVILLTLGILFFVALLINNYKNKEISTANSDPFFAQLTPTIYPTKRIGWNKFIHPLNHFNFEYPSYWNISLEQHRRAKDWYDINLSNKDSTDIFRINFQINGRDYPNYDEKKIEKNIGNRKIVWTFLYKNNEAIEAFTAFPNNDFGDKLIGLYIYLPKNNQEEFIKTVEEIIASLE